MPVFSRQSKAALATCHPDLRAVLTEAVRFVDFTVLEGYRSKAKQDQAFESGKSQVRWPNGKHNKLPSRAVDIAPYPIDWADTEAFVAVCNFIRGVGATMGVELRWGGDWDSDWQTKDEKFRDYGHLELTDK